MFLGSEPLLPTGEVAVLPASAFGSDDDFLDLLRENLVTVRVVERDLIPKLIRPDKANGFAFVRLNGFL